MEKNEYPELRETNKTSKVLDKILSALSARHTTETNDMNKPDPDRDTVQYADTSAGETATRAETAHSSTPQNTQWISSTRPRTEHSTKKNIQTDPTGRLLAKPQATKVENGQDPQNNLRDKEKGVGKVTNTLSTNYWQLWRTAKRNNQL